MGPVAAAPPLVIRGESAAAAAALLSLCRLGMDVYMYDIPAYIKMYVCVHQLARKEEGGEGVGDGVDSGGGVR